MLRVPLALFQSLSNDRIYNTKLNAYVFDCHLIQGVHVTK
jgi:hypothetical protein